VEYNSAGQLLPNKEIRNMKKLLVLAMVFSVMMVGVAAIAQDNMGQGSSDKAAAAPLKSIKGTIKADGDKYTFVSDKDNKSWDIMNPEAVKGHEGHHVEVSAHVYKDKMAIHVMNVKMLK
jgi:hypothetical protein